LAIGAVVRARVGTVVSYRMEMAVLPELEIFPAASFAQAERE
jgi:hypothetical protein